MIKFASSAIAVVGGGAFIVYVVLSTLPALREVGRLLSGGQ